MLKQFRTRSNDGVRSAHPGEIGRETAWTATRHAQKIERSSFLRKTGKGRRRRAHGCIHLFPIFLFVTFLLWCSPRCAANADSRRTVKTRGMCGNRRLRMFCVDTSVDPVRSTINGETSVAVLAKKKCTVEKYRTCASP